MDATIAYLTALHELMAAELDADGLADCLATFEVNSAEIPPDSAAHIRVLIVTLACGDRLPDLLTWLQASRPSANWPPLPDPFVLPDRFQREDILLVARYAVYEESGEVAQTIIGDLSDGIPIGKGVKPNDFSGSEPPPEPIFEMIDGPPEELSMDEVAASPLGQQRRLEAAMPPISTVQQTTEILVMVARKDSAGLAAFLPVEAPDGGEIDVQDVVDHSAEIVFPNPAEPITVWLGVDAPDSDFTIERPFRSLSVRADRDSAFESFFLMPLRAGNRVPVTVSLYGDEAKTDVLGRVRLATNVQADDSAEPATDPLTFGRAPVTIHIGDEITVGDISDATGVAIGGGASVTVAEAGASGMAPGGIMLFASLHALVAPINPAISPLVEQLRAQALLGEAANDTIVSQLLTAICAAVPATQEVIRVLAEGLGSAVAKPATAAFLETLTAPAPGL